MAYLRRQLQTAIADHADTPVREAKIRGIRREFYVRRDTLRAGVTLQTEAQHLARIRAGKLPIIPRLRRLVALARYGRRQANAMLRIPLPQVVAYDPVTDEGWPE